MPAKRVPGYGKGSYGAPTAASRPTRVPAVVVALALLAAGCGGGAGTATTDTVATTVTGSVRIVATTSIVADIVRSVAGDAAGVEVLIPAGTDPHDFVASSRQVALMQAADLVVAVGLGLEEGLIAVLGAVAEAGTPVLELAPLLDPIPYGLREHEHDDHDERSGDDDGPDHGDEDPHFWMDPIRVGIAARHIAEALAVIEPGVDWEAAAAAYADDMGLLGDEIGAVLAAVPDGRRFLVTNHDALGYLADRYGLEVVGTLIPGGTTLGAPSAAELARLVEVIEDLQIPAIFAETIDTVALADALASEVGHDVAVVILTTDSLGEPGTDTGTLAGLLLTNARLIADALG